MEYKKLRLTRAERENLTPENQPHYTGFNPRPLEYLAHHPRPHSTLDIECCQFLRTPSQECANPRSSVEHRLWLAAGQVPIAVPQQKHSHSNSNIWRNFRRSFHVNYSTQGGQVTDAVAALYPVNIPAPSQVGEFTLDKYLRETKLFNNETLKSLAIQRTATEISELKKLRCRSQARNPPMNEKGDILPPHNYKKYAHQFVAAPSPAPTPEPPGQKTDIFGRRYTPRSRPNLWKLSYRLNHPRFEELQSEIQRNKQMIISTHILHTDRNLQQMFASPSLRHGPTND